DRRRAERGRLGAARGRDRVGVRRRRPRREPGRRHGGGLRRHGVRRGSPWCRRARRVMVSSYASSETGRGASREEFNMLERPYTLLSCALSIDGYLGSASPRRLELSNDADFDRVDAVRASCDAILVGAATVRLDNPRLLVRSPTRREARTARGLPPTPIKVTVTERVGLDPQADFFTAGEIEKLVYCARPR